MSREGGDTARIKVDDYRQIEPALAGPNKRDSTGPFLVCSIRREILIKRVGRNIESVIAVRCRFQFAAPDDLYTVRAHQVADTPVSNIQAQILKFLGHARSATLIECKHSTAVQCMALQSEAVLLADVR